MMTTEDFQYVLDVLLDEGGYLDERFTASVKKFAEDGADDFFEIVDTLVEFLSSMSYFMKRVNNAPSWERELNNIINEFSKNRNC